MNSVIVKKSFNLASVVADYSPVAEIQSSHTHEDGGKIFSYRCKFMRRSRSTNKKFRIK